MATNPNNWGVTPTGYVLPTLAELIAEEQAAMLAGNNQLTLPPGSKDAMIAENRAKIQLRNWQGRQCEYFSRNPCNASGCQLDQALGLLGYTRKVINSTLETDEEFPARWKSRGTDGGWVSKLQGQILNMPGVCRVRVWTNEGDFTDPFTGLEPGSYEVVYEEESPGSADKEAIAKLVWLCSTGCKRVGKVTCRVEDDQGVCREVKLSPATVVPYCIRIIVNTYDTSCGCDDATETAIRERALEILQTKNKCGRNIGDPIYPGLLQTGLNVGGIDVVGLEFAPSGVDDDGNCTCDNVPDDGWTAGALNLGHCTVPSFDLDCICVESRDL